MSAVSDTEGSVYSDAASNEAPVAQEKPSEPESVKEPPVIDPAPEQPSKKRKRGHNDQPTKTARLKSRYNDGYRQLYNSTVTELTENVPARNPNRLTPSQHGVSKWTVSEKQMFFNALSRYGENNIPKITAAVSTKAEPEIRDFLLTLKEGFVENQFHDVHHMRISLDKIPAAAEISEACCKKIESAGKTLSMFQHIQDTVLEKKKYGDQWLLTESIAASIDSLIASNDSKEHEQQDVEERLNAATDVVPAARLLNLSAWLKLSDHVFMNAGGKREDENWRSLAEDDEELGIFHSAFADFHKLAVSVTRRLVHVSLTQATSRLRARDKPYHEPISEPAVRKQDVVTAIDILNMPKNAREFWVTAPCRSGVLVYEKPSQLKEEDLKTLAYKEVERKLRGEVGRPRKSDSFQDGKDEVTADAASDSDATSHSDGSGDDSEDEESCDMAQDEYAEQCDQQQSQLEELQLWEILGKPRMSTLNMVAGKPPMRPAIDRKMGEELRDWRDLVDCKFEWERYGEPVPESEFKETDRRRRHARGTSSRTRRGSTKSLQTNEDPDAMEVDGRSLPEEGQETEVSQTTDNEDLEDRPISDKEEGDAQGEDDEARDGDQDLPIRRTLQPRHARNSAASSMAALPPYPEVEESSGDEYQHNQDGSP